jgi:hypothetical protein
MLLVILSIVDVLNLDSFIFLRLLIKGYWGNGGNGTFTQFSLNPLFPQKYYKNHKCLVSILSGSVMVKYGSI